MSKLIRSLFGKKKDKKIRPKLKLESTRSSVRKREPTSETEVIIGPSYGNVKVALRPSTNKQFYRRTSDSLSRDSAYLNRLYGIDNRKKRQSVENVQRKSAPFQNTTPVVYAASVPRNSSQFNHRNTIESNEPFPYQMYDPTPRRSTLYYGVDFDGKPLHSESLRYSEENPADYSVPSTSKNDGYTFTDPKTFQDELDRFDHQKRRITIITPSEKDETPIPYNDDNLFVAEPVRKTILRIRPHSSAFVTPRESVKMMVFRADEIEHPPLTLGNHVRPIPLKNIKHNPVLMTDDGRLLKPADKFRIRNSVSPEEDTNLVRVSMTELDSVRRRASKASKNEPVYYSRKSVDLQSARHSLAESESGRRYSNRDFSIEPEREALPFDVEDNKPMMYAVPVTTSRKKSTSVMRQSFMEPKNLQRKSLANRKSESGRRYSSRELGIEPEREFFPFDMEDNKPMVYAVPAITTRKKSTSILRQSFMEPKNQPRYSYVDYDQHRYSYAYPDQQDQRHSIGLSRYPYKARAKGDSDISDCVQVQESKPITVYEVHNFPIKNSNPRNSESKSPKKDVKFKEQNTRKSTLSKRKEKELENLTHDDQSEETLPQIPRRSRSNSEWIKNIFSKKGRKKSSQQFVEAKDYCGLMCPSNVQMVSSIQQTEDESPNLVPSSTQTNIEDDLDFLCYPADSFSKSSTAVLEPDQKLRWRIIIKKGQ